MKQRTRQLLRKLLSTARREGIPFAVGGGLAVNLHGYARETLDVDVYFRLEDRAKIIRALRVAGCTIERLFAPNHYAAFLPGTTDIRYRIDLMFPEGDPELAAVEKPTEISANDLGIPGTIPTFPIELLIIAKLQAAIDYEGARHAADIRTLYELGAFEPETIRIMLKGFEPELVPVLEKILEDTPPSRRRSRKRL